MRSIINLIFLLVISNMLFAQDPLSTLFKKYASSKPDDALFVHYDKNVYSNNEIVYLTGYLLAADVNHHSVLSVALIRDADSLVVSQKKFMMSSGIAFGSLMVPDSILVGSYYLLAYTNLMVNGKPKVIFRQPIHIKSGKEPSFLASIKIVKQATEEQKINHVLLSVTSNDKRFLPKPTTVTYNYDGKTVTTKTDGFGQVTLQLPIISSQQNLAFKLKYEKDSSFMNIVLPKPKYKAVVKFYPEGGDIINGVLNSIAWEAKDERMSPLSLKAILYENEISIDTIETNSHGIGKFRVLANAESRYKVKLIHSELVDSTYFLPKIKDDGLALEIRKPLCLDTLEMVLRTNKEQHAWLRVHNFKESFIYAPIHISNQRKIKIPISFKGLATVTITDSLNRPLAERMIFGNYDKQAPLSVTTDQTTYQKRKKVSLSLKLTDTNEMAFVSIACVQANRIEVGKMNDIQSYAYLYNQLQQLPASGSLNALQNMDYVNSILSVKGWRRYSWSDLSNLSTTQYAHTDSLKIFGKIVTNQDKPIKKSTSVVSFGGLNLLQFNTDDNGDFELPLKEALTPFDKKLYLFVAKNGDLQTIKIRDDYESQNQLLAKTSTSLMQQPPSTLVNTEEMKLSRKEKVLQLKEVTITKNKDGSFYGTNGRNACGDYVCHYNILNCPNHVNDANNKQPIAGRSYLFNGMQTIYAGCSDEKNQKYIAVNGLSMAKEFYVDNYQQLEEPAYFSTLYWNYLKKIDKIRATSVEFYTGDIIGKFKIIVQGISNKDYIYQEHEIEVKE